MKNQAQKINQINRMIAASHNLPSTAQNAARWTRLVKAREKMTGETVVGTIDITPTWSGALPMYLILLKDGDAKGRMEGMKGLQQMAKLADMYVNSVKTKENGN